MPRQLRNPAEPHQSAARVSVVKDYGFGLRTPRVREVLVVVVHAEIAGETCERHGCEYYVRRSGNGPTNFGGRKGLAMGTGISGVARWIRAPLAVMVAALLLLSACAPTPGGAP